MTRKLTHHWFWIMCGVLCFAVPAAAQTGGGQVCVRAFEDRNANGLQDAGEPRITRGVATSLADDQGIIIASGLMEESPTAATGTYCFQRLEAGQYRLRVSSADYTPTTPTEFVTAVTGTDVQVFEYGGQLIPMGAAPTTGGDPDLTLTETEQRSLLTRLVLSGGGALLVMAAMGVVGAVVYFLFGRARPVPPPRSTGSMPAVGAPPTTGAMPPMSGGQGYGPVLPATNRPQMPVDDGTDIPQRPPAEDDFEFDPFDDRPE